MSNDPVFLTTASQAELDDTCGMAYWLSELHHDHGIIHKDWMLKEALLEETHRDLRTIALSKSIPTLNDLKGMVHEVLGGLTEDDKRDTKKMELLYRRLGWLVAWTHFEETLVRDFYETIDISDEIVLDRDPLWAVAHPDRILRSKTSREIIYREFVLQPAALNGRYWLNSWQYRMRLHVGMAAANQTLEGIKISYGQVIGLSEGYYSHVDGHLIHPYVWAYHNATTDTWSMSVQPSNEGWKLTPVWEYRNGLVEWVLKLGAAVSHLQFQLSPAVALNEVRLSDWVARRLHRERTIRKVKPDCVANEYQRGVHFERRTERCRPSHGEACQYVDICWKRPGDVQKDFFPHIPLKKVKVAEVVRE